METLSWILNSGASHRVTNDFSNINNASVYRGSDGIIVGNGAQLSITHVGNSKFDTPTVYELKLNKVLHAPRVASNLVSISTLY